MKTILDSKVFAYVFWGLYILFIFIEPIVSVFMTGMFFGLILREYADNEGKIGGNDEE